MTESIRPLTSPEHTSVASMIDLDAIDDLLIHKPSTGAFEKPSFALFSDLSEQLTKSYGLLEKQVAQLSVELNTVSEQRMQELRVREQVANRLEQLMNLLPGGVVVLDHRGVIIEINPAAQAMLEPDLTGQYWRDVISRCFSPKSDDGHEVSNHQGRRINIATGSLGQDGQIILLTDQTQTRQLQAELSRHERLTALGKMVSTLAHQVRTPLSSAMLYASHLLDSPLSGEQQQRFTKKLVNRLHEMERQVRDMLMFVKPDIALDDRLSLGELQQSLAEAMEMALIEHSLVCHWENAQPDCYIRCHKDALTGALLNLVNNSLQAMSDDGHLAISLEVQGSLLIMTVCDNGSGISETEKEQIHDLFYTTKAHGTGIGLTVVDTVAKSHGGSFSLESNPGAGVSARLELPIVCHASNE